MNISTVFWRPIFIFSSYLLGSLSSAHAMAGFAEWSILTPGGNEICYGDGCWYEKYGVALRAPNSETILVSHLKHWRYFKGYVAGETKTSYFLFEESGRRVQTFDSSKEMEKHVPEKQLSPISDWRAAKDGWFESSMPWIWQVCQLKRQGKPELQKQNMKQLFGISCEELTETKRLKLDNATAWGQRCRSTRPQDRFDEKAKGFCDLFVPPGE